MSINIQMYNKQQKNQINNVKMKQKHNGITNDEGNNVKPLLQQTQC